MPPSTTEVRNLSELARLARRAHEPHITPSEVQVFLDDVQLRLHDPLLHAAVALASSPLPELTAEEIKAFEARRRRSLTAAARHRARLAVEQTDTECDTCGHDYAQHHSDRSIGCTQPGCRCSAFAPWPSSWPRPGVGATVKRTGRGFAVKNPDALVAAALAGALTAAGPPKDRRRPDIAAPPKPYWGGRGFRVRPRDSVALSRSGRRLRGITYRDGRIIAGPIELQG